MQWQEELLELARQLKQEHLFVTSERYHLQQLYEEVSKSGEKMFHVAWVTSQQKLILERLILAKLNPSQCYSVVNALDSVQFIDGYKQLGFHESTYGDFLKAFRENAKLAATCLVHGETLNQEEMQNVAYIIMSAVYSNSVLPEDERYVLEMLKWLMELQLAKADDPRRLLRRGSCAFSTIYKIFTEGLFSAKLFLTAALHNPIMHLLMEDDLFLDIDPGKAIVRFPPEERLKRFGREGTPEYKSSLQNYRNWTIGKLVNLANLFISSLKLHLFCFPRSLCFLVRQLCSILTKAGKVTAGEIGKICADVVFTCFVCPAIVNPDAYGITSDAPISYIARFNLMQVGQILQVLAMSKWDPIDSKLMDLYGRFEKDCISSLIEVIMEGEVSELPVEPSALSLQSLNRTSVIITENDLNSTVAFMRAVCSSCRDGFPAAELKLLDSLVGSIPASPAKNLNQQSLLQPQVASSPSSAKKMSMKQGKSSFRGIRTSTLLPSMGDEREHGDNEGDGMGVTAPHEVLVISLGNAPMECPGMLPESKVLAASQSSRSSRVRLTDSGALVETQEKRTRFSLSHDQDSTSDNLEAISEAASNQSIASSVDLEAEEAEADNLSDMVSANVSGRGTPLNVSGRDTPQSQPGEDGEGEGEGEEAAVRVRPPLHFPVKKQSNEDITERFGKFEIRTMLGGDETVSMVSDTWSTDVLASDSEPAEQNMFERLQEISEEMTPSQRLDVTETASDAWSTDVLASESGDREDERLRELDSDVASLASGREGDGQQFELNVETFSSEDTVTPQASGGHGPADDDQEEEEEDGACGSDYSEHLHSAEIFAAAHSPPIGGSLRSLGAGMDPRRDVTKDREPGIEAGPSQLARLIKGRPADVSREQRSDPGGTRPNTGASRHLGDAGEDSPMKPQCREAYRLMQPREGDLISMQSLGRLSLVMDNIPPESLSAMQLLTDVHGFHGNREARGGASGQGAPAVFAGERADGVKSVTVKVNCVADSMHAVSVTVPTPPRPDSDLSAFDPLATPVPTGTTYDPLATPVPTGATYDPWLVKLGRPASDAAAAAAVQHSIDEFDPLRSGQTSGFTSAVPLPPPTTTTTMMKPVAIVDPWMPQNDVGRMFAPIDNSQENRGFQPIPGPGILKTRGSLDDGLASSLLPLYPGDHQRPSDASSIASSLEVEKGRTGSIGSSSSSRDGSFVDSSAREQQATQPPPQQMKESVPKSISFDSSIDREDNNQQGDKDQRKSIFKGFGLKSVFKGKLRKGAKYDVMGNNEASGSGDGSGIRRTALDDGSKPESGDDILAKYRKKPSSAAANEPQAAPHSGSPAAEIDPSTALWDDSQYLFADTKRKLRIVLSMVDLTTTHWSSPLSAQVDQVENHLVAFLRTQLAEAINLQDRSLVAQLHETLRCVRQFDKPGCRKLLVSLQEDYRRRAPYIAYLVRCRQALLATQCHLDRLLRRIQREKTICSKYITLVCVRFYLEKYEGKIQRFISDFKKLDVSDEKTDLVEQFLKYMYEKLEQDPTWQHSNERQLMDAQQAVERSLMSQIYIYAIYPNGDGDILRDQLLQEHIKKLSKVITPNHRDLKINKVFLHECPWPSAQAEIVTINAYKTPKDKLQCVIRCCSTIMNLLSLASDKSVPAADDFTPVIVYVIIKANPPSLLSTVQYVNSFYEKRLSGEESYWWAQFSSAIEFIKTMDYKM